MIHYLYYFACVILLFGAAIFVHEFGHYWMARRCGMKILAFAIGFGPKIFAWTRDGIEYSVRWIPAGGFVKLPQMITGPIEGETKADDIPPASPLAKILVAAAGPFMNVAFAFALATLIYWIGLPVLVNPSIVGYVNPSSPEGRMGIKQGDRIVAIGDHPVKSWDQVQELTVLSLTNVLAVTVEHSNRTTSVYHLHAEINPIVQVKMLNLDPMEHLIVGGVNDDSPGAAAHLQPGDEFLSFAGVSIGGYEQLTNLIQHRGGRETPLVVKRDGRTLALSVTPKLDSDSGNFRIGVAFHQPAEIYDVEHPLPWVQIQRVWDQITSTVAALTHPHESGVHVKELSGPVGILGALAAEVKTDFRRALSFLVLLNINLALINLLPVPVLDGGHILMAIIEKIRRRPLSLQLMEYTTTAFALLLILFMLYVTFFDIKRLPLLRYVLNQKTQVEQPGQTPPAAGSSSPAPAPTAP